MKQDLELKNDEPVVIPDECGDSMWDEVLQQEAPSAPKGGTLESETLECFLKKQTVGNVVD